MPQTNTPTGRVTRSGSNSSSGLTLADIKDLIESTTTKILTSLRSEIDGLTNIMTTLMKRVDEIENKHKKLEEVCETET